MKSWDDLLFWQSEDWASVQRRLHELDMAEVRYCPDYPDVFSSFKATPFDSVRVAIIGQDPYPDPQYATGLAFSIPRGCVGFPPTLETIFKEYEHDLHYPAPTSGDLSDWAHRGVFLWNILPTCSAGKSQSHDWPEYGRLSKEVIESLVTKKVVLVFLGAKARSYVPLVYNLSNIRYLELSHPSPRANLRSRTETKFIGSRVFTRVNDYLCSLGLDPIDWRLL